MQPASEVPSDSTTLEKQVEILKRELLESQKMAALGELVSTTTHEFNNVLTTILNYAKLGLRHGDEPTRTRALEKILSAAQRAERITNGVLGLARRRGNDAAPTNLAELASEALVLIEREMSKHRVSVETRFETEHRAQVVPSQIQQVLLNLMTNARQAMPNGGRIVVRVCEDAKAKTIDLSVRDNGPGIPPEVLPKIFDRNFSTKSGPDATGKGGAGLGLVACREIIESHGGRLRVETTVGQGTAFILKLPAAKSVPTAAAPIAQLGVPSAVVSVETG